MQMRKTWEQEAIHLAINTVDHGSSMMVIVLCAMHGCMIFRLRQISRLDTSLIARKYTSSCSVFLISKSAEMYFFCQAWGYLLEREML